MATFRTLTLKAAIGNAGRGYRSKAFPSGLDVDITTYLSTLIEVKRGFVASLDQTLNGDETRGFSVNHTFIKEVAAYPGLLDIIKKIEGLVVGSSTHAAAVLLFDEEDRLTDHCSLMRAPNGDLCSALDLHKVEEVGAIKYDWLILSTLDVQATCLELLQEHGLIPKELSLRECFNKYINPNTIDYSDPRIWDALYEGNVLSVFQWDAASGRRGILATRPKTLDELSAVNGLIRLMTADGEEDQIDRFVRIKENPQSFEDEMIEAGLNARQREIMHRELDHYHGCTAMQESFMILSQELAGYSLADADKLRKTVAKKVMSDIEKQKEKFYAGLREKSPELSEKGRDYLWSVVIAPSLGYGFSLNHALPYSIIGVQCLLLGGVLFPPIYWQTACLLQRSGALDGKTTDHNKIAKAASLLISQGVDVKPIDINKSEGSFTLSPQDGRIYFGMDGVKGVKSKAIEDILEKRPFTSFEDFLSRYGGDITSLVALLKAGAFQSFGAREEIIDELAAAKADYKSVLNGRNFAGLSKAGLLPETSEELVLGRRAINFNLYLKKLEKVDGDFLLDNKAVAYLDSVGLTHDGERISASAWKLYHDTVVAPVKNWLKTNQQEVLAQFNGKQKEAFLAKYFAEEVPALAEIATLGYCFSEHPLADEPRQTNFFELPETPEVATMIPWRGIMFPIYALHRLLGIVIAKDKLHSSFTLLTVNGPVEVKLRKEQFAHYDAQISAMGADGKKKVLEKSWLSRGTVVAVQGFRQADQFIGKKYKNSPMKHMMYKITSLYPELSFQHDRMVGTATESEEE